jgi:5' nucleotidase, deoxy (Pyrimidine), cytosolic type C protein (NT5C)
MLPKNLFASHTHIGFDLDETLASTVGGFLDMAHQSGMMIQFPTIDTITSYNLETLDPKMTPEVTQQIWREYILSTPEPQDVAMIDHARDGVELLLQHQKKCSIVTARPSQDPVRVERTLKWVERYFCEIPRERVYFVDHFSPAARPKSEVCLREGMTLCIDDSLDVARDLTEHGITVILLEKPWNRESNFTHPLLHRVPNWVEIIDNIE